MAKEFNCPFFETSAALRHNVEEVFSEIVRCIRSKENADYYSRKGEKVGERQRRRRRGGALSRLLCCCSSDSSS